MLVLVQMWGNVKGRLLLLLLLVHWELVLVIMEGRLVRAGRARLGLCIPYLLLLLLLWRPLHVVAWDLCHVLRSERRLVVALALRQWIIGPSQLRQPMRESAVLAKLALPFKVEVLAAHSLIVIVRDVHHFHLNFDRQSVLNFAQLWFTVGEVAANSDVAGACLLPVFAELRLVSVIVLLKVPWVMNLGRSVAIPLRIGTILASGTIVSSFVDNLSLWIASSVSSLLNSKLAASYFHYSLNYYY